MSDTTNPGLTKATRRFGAGRPKVAPFARFEGTSAWRKDRRRVRAYARFRAAAKQASQDTKILSALDDRGGRDAGEPGRKRPVCLKPRYAAKLTPTQGRNSAALDPTSPVGTIQYHSEAELACCVVYAVNVGASTPCWVRQAWGEDKRFVSASMNA